MRWDDNAVLVFVEKSREERMDRGDADASTALSSIKHDIRYDAE